MGIFGLRADLTQRVYAAFGGRLSPDTDWAAWNDQQFKLRRAEWQHMPPSDLPPLTPYE